MSIFKTTVPVLSFRYLLILFLVFLVSVVAILTGLWAGSVDMTFPQLVDAFSSSEPSLISRIIWEIRMPRVLNGFFVGGMLALAGALMQILLRNPLAEPYVLGISGGAAVFVLLAMLAGVGGIALNISAFTGAFISMSIVFILSRLGGDWNPLRILLTGVVIAAGWSAGISFILVVSPASQVHSMLFWLMGDLAYTRYTAWNLYALLIITLLCMVNARGMNLLSQGELSAASLGVSVQSLRYFIYFAASLLTSIAVMQAGSIGFVGLVVPHMVRLLFGSDHRLLIPLSVLTGGSLLVIADALARTIIAPQQLPVGVLTAMIGVPLFLLLLQTIIIRQKP